MVYAGFRDARRDIPDPPPAQSAPDPHDEENMDARPDQEEMEQAINKFLQLLEKQEKRGFKNLATLLSHLPKPAQGSACSTSVAKAIEAGFLTALDKDQAYMFTTLELLWYRHAQDHRLLTWDILGYPSLFGDILGLPTRLFLSFRCSRIVLLLLTVTVQIKGLSQWQQSLAWPIASAGMPVYWALGSLRLSEFQGEALGTGK